MPERSDSEQIESRNVGLSALKYFSARLGKTREAIDRYIEATEQIPIDVRALLENAKAETEDVRDEIEYYIGSGPWSPDREREEAYSLSTYKKKATHGLQESSVRMRFHEGDK